MVRKYIAEMNLKTSSYEVFDTTNGRRRAVGIPTLREALRIALALNAQVAQGTDKEEAR
jgi:hypothetical protein